MGKPWLKLWTETIHDRKLTRVSPTWRWAWIGLLALAAETDSAGKLELSPGVALTDPDIVAELAINPDDWQQAKAYFLQLGMLRQQGESMVVTNYDKRQAAQDPTGAERQQRWRSNHNAKGNGSRNALRNDRYAPLPSRVESDLEEESDHPPLPPKIEATKPNGQGGIDDFSLIETAHASFVGPKMSLDETNTYLEWLKLTPPTAIIAALQAAHANKARAPFSYAIKILGNQQKAGELPGRGPKVVDFAQPLEVIGSWM